MSDIYSQYAWRVPLKEKTGTSITTALETLFRDRKSITLQWDKGIEFVNSTVQEHLKRQGVNIHRSHNLDIKGAIIERFNRTLKKKMYKYFTKNNTYRYLDVINKLLASYNNSVHSTLGMPQVKWTPQTFTLYDKRWSV